ncbi:MAG: hypothetical protein ABIH63_01850 [archaeon]
MIITLCCRAKFFDRLHFIEDGIKSVGHEVLLPSMVDYHHLEETALFKIQHNLIRDHFKKIDNSHAIYVANFDAKGLEGYVGGSSLIEMGHAFYREIPIFLMKRVDNMLSYREEVLPCSLSLWATIGIPLIGTLKSSIRSSDLFLPLYSHKRYYKYQQVHRKSVHACWYPSYS